MALDVGPITIPVKLDLTEAYAQIEELRAALAGVGVAVPSPGPRVGDVIHDPSKLADLPDGTVIEDRDGDEWTRSESGWHFRRETVDTGDPSDYAPFTIIALPETAS